MSTPSYYPNQAFYYNNNASLYHSSKPVNNKIYFNNNFYDANQMKYGTQYYNNYNYNIDYNNRPPTKYVNPNNPSNKGNQYYSYYSPFSAATPIPAVATPANWQHQAAANRQNMVYTRTPNLYGVVGFNNENLMRQHLKSKTPIFTNQIKDVKSHNINFTPNNYNYFTNTPQTPITSHQHRTLVNNNLKKNLNKTREEKTKHQTPPPPIKTKQNTDKNVSDTNETNKAIKHGCKIRRSSVTNKIPIAEQTICELELKKSDKYDENDSQKNSNIDEEIKSKIIEFIIKKSKEKPDEVEEETKLVPAEHNKASESFNMSKISIEQYNNQIVKDEPIMNEIVKNEASSNESGKDSESSISSISVSSNSDGKIRLKIKAASTDRHLKNLDSTFNKIKFLGVFKADPYEYFNNLKKMLSDDAEKTQQITDLMDQYNLNNEKKSSDQNGFSNFPVREKFYKLVAEEGIVSLKEI